MVRLRFILAAVLTAVFLVSCATLPLPSAKQPSLVVGEILRSSQASPDVRNKVLTARLPAGILIYVHEVTTATEHKFSSDPNGRWTAFLPGGQYELDKLYLATSTGKISNTFTYTLPTGKYRFRVSESGVTNAGRWEIIEPAAMRVAFSGSGHFAEVQKEFEARYADSPWNHETWTNANTGAE